MNMIDDITNQITAWDNVTSAPHRFGGVEYRLHKTEIGHVHRGGQVDILFSKAIREQLIAENKAELHHILPESRWITFRIRDHVDDIDHAVWRMRLSYLQKMIRLRRDLNWEDSVIQLELKTLGTSELLQKTLQGRKAHQ